MNPAGNHDRFPTLPDGSRDILHDHSHVDTWKSMEKLLATGKAKAIGVSNVSNTPLSPFRFPLLPSLRDGPASSSHIAKHRASPLSQHGN